MDAEELCLWREEWPRFDRMLEPFGAAVLGAAELRPGAHVLDVGCGAGALALQAGAMVGPAGSAIGVDLDAGLLAVACERASGVPNVVFERADACGYRPAARLDAVVSRFGTMALPGPVAAFANLGEALRPGGRLAFVAWARPEANGWHAVPYQAAGAEVPTAHVGPFSLADPERARTILRDAGFVDIEVEEMAAPTWVGADLDDALGFLRRTVAGHVGPAALEPLLATAATLLRPHCGPNGVELPGVALVCRARTRLDR